MKNNFTLLLLLTAIQISYAQDNKIGIGTYTPQAQLHVKGDINNQKILKIETSDGKEVLNANNDGSVELSFPPKTSSSNSTYDILTRNKITNKIETISSLPLPEADPVWNQARVSTKTYKGNIPSNADLNNYTETGIYNVLLNDISVTTQNFPIANIGMLEVFTSENTTYQIYHTGGADNSLYSRNKLNYQWSNWRKVLVDEDLSSYEKIVNNDIKLLTKENIGNKTNTITGNSTTLYPNENAVKVALDTKANDSDVVRLTGDQTIDGYKTFNSTLTVSTSNFDDFGINAFSEMGTGVNATSDFSTALRATSNSGPAAQFKTNSGSRIVSFDVGFDNKAYINIQGGYVKSSASPSNILLAGGGDLVQGTAFNKNFGKTSGTVADGAYSPSKSGEGASGTWGINISGNANSASGLGVYSWDPTIASTGLDFLFGRTGSNSIKIIDSENVKSWLGLGSMAYQPADPFVYSYKGVLNYDNNADDISSNGVYINNTGNGYNNSNFASDISVLSVIGNNSNYGQVQQDFDWNGNQRYRVRLGESGFGMWQRVLVEADLDAIATKDFVVANRITIPHLKFSELDKTVWNNGKGDFSDNTSFGDKALWKNTIGRNNTANGFHTLLQNQEGTSNTANGMSALKSNRDGSFNTANGAMALLSNENGSLNTANGYQALRENINGSSNTANGYQAGHLAYPYVYNTSSNASVFLGAYTKPLGDNQENQIVIGYAAVGAGSNTFTLGNTDIKKTVIGGVIQKRTLDAAPSSATDTGTLGEIRVTSSHIYVCIATNTWVRSELASW